MTHHRVALLVAALLIGPGAAAYAQMIVGPATGPGPGPAPTLGPAAPQPGSSGMIVGPAVGPGPGPMSGPMMGGRSTPGMPPCMSQFLPLREEAEKRAGVLQAAINKKKPPTEMCQLFRNFSEADHLFLHDSSSNSPSVVRNAQFLPHLNSATIKGR